MKTALETRKCREDGGKFIIYHPDAARLYISVGILHLFRLNYVF